MQRIAFLGTGAMGARVAANLIADGRDVVVWNRTPARTAELVGKGAIAAETPRAAVDGADLAIAMVRDDDASLAVWLDPETGALGGLKPDAVAVDCATLSVDGARSLAAAFADAGRAFLEAPVAGSRPQAEARALVFLVGGETATVERVRPTLETLGGPVHHVGPVGAGATVKLVVNAMLGAQAAQLAELLAFARAHGLDAASTVEILGTTSVASPALKGLGAAMAAANFAPQFPIELVAKDFAQLQRSAGGAATPVSTAAADVFRAALDAGHGDDNIAAVARLHQ
ncbi:MAG: NAD(P)-dependent oxidoreductase [Parvularculaceae bacterium]